MKQVTIRLFATLRERARTGSLRRSFPETSTVADIWRELLAEFPALGGHQHGVAFAVNREYVGENHCPRDDDEVAFLPPVSGGGEPAGSEAPWVGTITIVREPLEVSALEQSVAEPAAGGTVTFVGTTRNQNAGRHVIALEYEAYEPMALSELRKLAREAGERWQIKKIAIAHRIGPVPIGEPSVAIAVSAAHRSEAFEACRFAIDRLKQVAPIWKKEYFEGGEVWVGCQTSHPPEIH